MKNSVTTFSLLVAALHGTSGFLLRPLQNSAQTNGRTNYARVIAMKASASDATRAPNPVIKVAASGMSLLKPIFGVEAQIQAALLGAISRVDKAAVADEINANAKKNKALIYTYSLSPFSSEALGLLEASGYDFTNIELGAEWFLLGGQGSQTRVELAARAQDGATSLPKIFIGGECIGGCKELATLVESGELESLMKKARVPKRKV